MADLRTDPRLRGYSLLPPVQAPSQLAQCRLGSAAPGAGRAAEDHRSPARLRLGVALLPGSARGSRQEAAAVPPRPFRFAPQCADSDLLRSIAEPLDRHRCAPTFVSRTQQKA